VSLLLEAFVPPLHYLSLDAFDLVQVVEAVEVLGGWRSATAVIVEIVRTSSTELAMI
jgi:hypothetical protein